jgi:hypothetical protein
MKPQIRITIKELDPYPHPYNIENSDLHPRKKVKEGSGSAS